VVGAGFSHAEVQVRGVDRTTSGYADRAEPFAAPHRVSTRHVDRGQMEVRGVKAPVVGADRHRQPGAAGRPGEGDRAADGRHHRMALGGADVDTAVLPGGVRVVAVRVGRQDLATYGPGPPFGGARGRCPEQEEQQGDYERERCHGPQGRSESRPVQRPVALLSSYVTKA